MKSSRLSRSRQSRPRKFLIESLESKSMLTQLTPGNLLVTSESNNTVQEYDPSGQFVQEFATSQVGSEKPRDVSVDSNGDIQVYYGTFNPTLDTIHPAGGPVDVHSFPGWSTVNNGSYGGVADYDNYVFLTDMNTSGASEQGILRVDTTDYSFERFATDRGFVDVTLGRDGLIYALEEFSPGKSVRSFDPVTLQQVGAVDLPHVDHRGIAVDADGNIFAPMWSGGEVRKYDSGGTLLQTLVTPINNLQDIDIHSDGRLLIGSRFGDVIQTDVSLSSYTTFSAGNDTIFVAFADDDPVASPPVNQKPTADDLDIDVPVDESVSFQLSGSDDSTNANDLTFTITSLPDYGVLTASGAPVVVGQTFVGAPTLEFEFAADNNDPHNSFDYTVTDDGTPPLSSDSATVTLTPVAVVGAGEVTLDGDGVVRIGGTQADDHFVIQESDGNLKVKLNGATISDTIPLSSVMEIRGWGEDGNDTFNIKGLEIDSILFGGAGHDRLYGGNANDLLFGGDGDDIIRGRSGADAASGGAGSDDIRGNRDSDLLFGGQLLSDFTIEQVAALRDQWEADQDVTAIAAAIALQVLDTEYDYIRGGGQKDCLVVSAADNFNTSDDEIFV